MEDSNEYQWYWETNRFYNAEELIGSLSLDNTLSAYVDPSAADGGQPSSGASRNIVSERNRRQKLNDRLYALRAIVPNITKMDKASIVKDSINYIQELQEQEERIQGEIAQLEYSRACENQADQTSLCKKNKRTVHEQQHLSSYVSGGAGSSASPPIQVIEVGHYLFLSSFFCHLIPFHSYDNKT
ncbi:hypothetical protein DCAR_0416231 [Daucus carota subsp. sativus]|uniref:BHLH domain-containing protein n=1 Tax=Daucus carota subsp. sativus TaxID=79200 RepID=A0AAF0WY56_DAUCS|nr:hypothetical protein DCAR_0416231 [Daucus carota subsp. sativus]